MRTTKRAEELSEILYDAYKDGDNTGVYNDYLIECIKEKFWGRVVKDHLPIFNKTWKILNEKKYTAKNPFVYGDDDVGVWIELTKSESKKVIASTCYCSCADDNTHIFILDDHSILNAHSIVFRVATVWPRQINKRDKHPWGDDRDIKLPSLNTYRERDFRYGYYDCRDKGSCFLYEEFKKGIAVRVENAHWDEGAITNALRTLRWHLEALEEEHK